MMLEFDANMKGVTGEFGSPWEQKNRRKCVIVYDMVISGIK